jgi:hypothetical protein
MGQKILRQRHLAKIKFARGKSELDFRAQSAMAGRLALCETFFRKCLKQFQLPRCHQRCMSSVCLSTA